MSELKNITLKKGVVLNQRMRDKLQEIDPDFEGTPQICTSGIREAADQIRIIRKYLVSKGLNKTYPEAMVCGIDDKEAAGNYVWQMAWSNLLNIGVIINPPRAAVVLMDYIRGGGNKKGQTIQPSPHMRGLDTACFDFSGLSGVAKAKKLKEAGKIRNYLPERENNCLHIDI